MTQEAGADVRINKTDLISHVRDIHTRLLLHRLSGFSFLSSCIQSLLMFLSLGVILCWVFCLEFTHLMYYTFVRFVDTAHTLSAEYTINSISDVYVPGVLFAYFLVVCLFINVLHDSGFRNSISLRVAVAIVYPVVRGFRRVGNYLHSTLIALISCCGLLIHSWT